MSSSTRLSFLELPLEIHTQIFSYLVPNDFTFNFGSQRPVPPEKNLTWRCGTKVRWNSGSHDAGDVQRRKDVMSMLLTHPTIYYTVVRELYSNNTFCFPDIFTVAAFANQISPCARKSIRYIAIDGVGSEMSPRTLAFYSQHSIVEPSVQETVCLFPGLKELMLGNVGPGLVRDMIRVVNGVDTTSRMEDVNNWRMPGIELVAKLIGLNSDSISPRIQNDASPNPLANGRVVCARALPEVDLNKSWGYLRLFGTRIIRRGAEVVLTERDQEIFDVSAVLQRAQFFSGNWAATMHKAMPHFNRGPMSASVVAVVAG